MNPEHVDDLVGRQVLLIDPVEKAITNGKLCLRETSEGKSLVVVGNTISDTFWPCHVEMIVETDPVAVILKQEE